MSDVGLIARESQQLNQDAVVDMIEIDLSRWGAGMIRFTPSNFGDSGVQFAGEHYDSLPCQLTGVEYTGQGQLPQPKLVVSGLSLELLAQLAGADNLIGAPLVHRRTYAKFLDTGAEPNPAAEWEPTRWILSQMRSQTDTTIEYLLRAEIDQQSMMIPRRQILNSCTNRYRVWDAQRKQFDYRGVTCPYAGAQCYDLSGAETSDPSKDACSLQYKSGCKKRFGNGVCPFSGVPNLRSS